LGRTNGKPNTELGRRDEHDLYTLESVVSKAESPAVRFELKTISSFGVFPEPVRSLEVVTKVLMYDGLKLLDPTVVTLFLDWRRMIIMQKHIPRTGLVCAVGVRSR